MIEVFRAPMIEVEPYTKDEITSLILASFRFSRGLSAAQHEILQFMAGHYGELLQSETIYEARETLLEPTMKAYCSPKTHPAEAEGVGKSLSNPLTIENVKQEIRLVTNDFAVCLDDSPPTSQTGDLANRLVEVDDNWKLGKHRLTTPVPYRSNVIHFGLLGHSTGHLEYDFMFAKVAEDILARDPSDYYRIILRHVAPYHLVNNPADQAEIETLLDTV